MPRSLGWGGPPLHRQTRLPHAGGPSNIDPLAGGTGNRGAPDKRSLSGMKRFQDHCAHLRFYAAVFFFAVPCSGSRALTATGPGSPQA